MEKLRNFFLFPLKAAGTLARIFGRIAVGGVGLVVMLAGMLAINPLGYYYIGIPVMLVGLLLLAKAVF